MRANPPFGSRRGSRHRPLPETVTAPNPQLLEPELPLPSPLPRARPAPRKHPHPLQPHATPNCCPRSRPRWHHRRGSPRKVNEYLFEDKPARLYERLAAAERDGVLVFGHTHKPWVHEYGGVLSANCGSVGKPKDGDPRGAFAVLQPAGDSWR